jgi:hypothetical protein
MKPTQPAVVAGEATKAPQKPFEFVFDPSRAEEKPAKKKEKPSQRIRKERSSMDFWVDVDRVQ